MLSGCHGDGVLASVGEAAVLVLMVLQKVVDGSQPQRATRAGATPSAGPVAVPPAVTAAATAIRIHLFTPFTRNKIHDDGKKPLRISTSFHYEPIFMEEEKCQS